MWLLQEYEGQMHILPEEDWPGPAHVLSEGCPCRPDSRDVGRDKMVTHFDAGGRSFRRTRERHLVIV